MWAWDGDRIESLGFWCYKGMGKRGEFKISLSNRKSGEILNSTKSDRVKMDWVIRGERRVF